MTSFKNFLSCIVFIAIFNCCQSETVDEWNARIDQKITDIRKKDAKIVLDSYIYGKNARLHVNQTSMDFPMGTAIKAQFIAECADTGVNDDYCNFVKDNYNYVVVENAMKWPQWEPKRDEFRMDKPDKALNWVLSNGMKARGHNLFWAVDGGFQIPDWVKPLKGDDMREAIDHRLETAVPHYDVRLFIDKKSAGRGNKKLMKSPAKTI